MIDSPTIRERGWNEETLFQLLEEFIEFKDLWGDLHEFLEWVADLERAEEEEIG